MILPANLSSNGFLSNCAYVIARRHISQVFLLQKSGEKASAALIRNIDITDRVFRRLVIAQKGLYMGSEVMNIQSTTEFLARVLQQRQGAGLEKALLV